MEDTFTPFGQRVSKYKQWRVFQYCFIVIIFKRALLDPELRTDGNSDQSPTLLYRLDSFFTLVLNSHPYFIPHVLFELM